MGTYEVVKPPVAVTIKDGKAAQWYGKSGAVLDLNDEQATDLGKRVRRIDDETESKPAGASSARRGAARQPETSSAAGSSESG